MVGFIGRRAGRQRGRGCLRDRRGHRGQVIPLAALMGIACLLLVGLVVDYGNASSVKRHDQGLADDSALSAAYFIQNGGSESTANTLVDSMVTANGLDSSKLTMSYLDSTGAATTNSASVSTVQASISDSSHNSFMSLIGIKTTPFTASGTAKLGRPGMPCYVCLLGSSGTGITVGGNSTVTVDGGSLITDSTASTPISEGAGNSVIAASTVGIVGGTPDCKGTCSPSPTTVTSVSDPFSAITAPSVTATGSCVANACTPGIYTGGLTFGSSQTYTLAPGIYVLPGSAFTAASHSTVTVSGTASPDTGNGALFYFTCSGYSSTTTSPCPSPAPTPSTSTCQFTDDATASLVLPPPDTGTWKGLSIFFDPNDNECISMHAGVNPSIGTIYAPDSQLQMQGGTGTNSTVVVASLTLQGGATMTVNPNTNGGGLQPTSGPLQPPSLTQ